MELTGAPMFNDNREQRRHVQRQHGTNWRSQWAIPLGTTPPTALILYVYTHFCALPHGGYPIVLGCDHAFSLLEVRHGRLTNHSTNKKVNYWLLRYAPATLLLDLHYLEQAFAPCFSLPHFSHSCKNLHGLNVHLTPVLKFLHTRSYSSFCFLVPEVDAPVEGRESAANLKRNSWTISARSTTMLLPDCFHPSRMIVSNSSTREKVGNEPHGSHVLM
jgi:hypothetical protein